MTAGMETIEEWRVISRAPDYAVSNLGRVKRIKLSKTSKPGRILKPYTSGNYIVVVLRMGGRSATQYIHRLVAEAFLPDGALEGYQVAHYDGDSHNNVASNLRWASPVENARDKKRHGTDQVGNKHHLRKINEQQALEIISLRKSGMYCKDIAAKFGLHTAYVSLVANGKRWGHLQ